MTASPRTGSRIERVELTGAGMAPRGERGPKRSRTALTVAISVGLLLITTPRSADAQPTPQQPPVDHHPAGPVATPSPTPSEILSMLVGPEIRYDQHGLIVHADGGGDTAQREGWYWFGVALREKLGLAWDVPAQPRRLNFDQVRALLEPANDGVYYRHPKDPRFNKPRDKEYGLSRDQLVPVVAMLGIRGKTAEIKRLWDALPETFMGKHSFNGNYRNFLGQDGQDCMAIKDRGCDATADCSLKTDSRNCSLQLDTRDCSLKTDTRDCSLKVDTRDCSLQVDTRSCGHDISTPFGTVHVNDPICEAAKAAQNVAYKAAHDSCELAKAAQNGAHKVAHDQCEIDKAAQQVAYKGEHDACEVAKGAQNLAYKAAHDKCEAEKATQNGLYAAEKAACETGKTLSKAACEADKAAAQTLCMTTNVHSGDLIGPSTVALFRRAMGEDPMSPTSALTLSPVTLPMSLLGDAELLANVAIRSGEGVFDKDATGDDLNLIVMLLMSRLPGRFESEQSKAAVAMYALKRPHSYGSYLKAYRQQYGKDATDMKARLDKGIKAGWAPDVSAPVGATRWYHREEAGANPHLAELYRPVIDHYITPLAITPIPQPPPAAGPAATPAPTRP